MRNFVKFVFYLALFSLLSMEYTFASSKGVQIVCGLEGPLYEGTIEGPISSNEWAFDCDHWGYDQNHFYGILTPNNLPEFVLKFNNIEYKFHASTLILKAPPQIQCKDIQSHFQTNGFQNFTDVFGKSLPGTATFISSQYVNIELKTELTTTEIIPISFGRKITDFSDCSFQLAR